MMMRGLGPLPFTPTAAAVRLAVPLARSLLEREPFKIPNYTYRVRLKDTPEFSRFMGAGALGDGMMDLAGVFVTKNLSGRTVLSRNLYALPASVLALPIMALVGVFALLVGFTAPFVSAWMAVRDGLGSELAKWAEGVRAQFGKKRE